MSLSKVIRFLPGGNRDAAKMGGKLVLLVEENQEVSNLLAHNLRRDGYAVDVALTAADALKYLDAQRYALAIVDWRLPDGTVLMSPIERPKLRRRRSSSVAIFSDYRAARLIATIC
jgi:DNA-binding response OmpR family regulator